jgi:hypothetical protein
MITQAYQRDVSILKPRIGLRRKCAHTHTHTHTHTHQDGQESLPLSHSFPLSHSLHVPAATPTSHSSSWALRSIKLGDRVIKENGFISSLANLGQGHGEKSNLLSTILWSTEIQRAYPGHYQFTMRQLKLVQRGSGAQVSSILVL